MTSPTEAAVDLVAAARDGFEQPDGPDRFALLDLVLGDRPPDLATVRLLALMAAGFAQPAADARGLTIGELLGRVAATDPSAARELTVSADACPPWSADTVTSRDRQAQTTDGPAGEVER